MRTDTATGSLRRIGGCMAGLIAGAIALAGCANPPPPTVGGLAQPLGVVAIVPSADAPRSNLVAFAKSKSEGAAKGAAINAGTTAGAITIAGVGATGAGAVALAFIAPFLIVAEAAGGAVAGSRAALSAEQSAAFEASLAAALDKLDVQHAMVARLQRIARDEGVLRMSEIASREAEPSAAVREVGVDTAIEVGIVEVGFERCARAPMGVSLGCDDSARRPRVALTLRARVRVLRVSDAALLLESSLAHASPHRDFAQWSADDGRVLLDAFERGYDELARRVHDELLWVTPLPLANHDSLWGVPGRHPSYGICWLAPVAPAAAPMLLSELVPAIVSPPADWCRGSPLHFPAVESLQPLLRWEAFPRALDERTLDKASLSAIGDVGYDLRVWEVEGCERGALVYERANLRSPEHRVEVALAPAQRFFWSFRARFKLDGRPGSTPWSFFDPTNCAAHERTPVQPHRFTTPAAAPSP